VKRRKFAAIIMAAGKGTRMQNPEIPKVMYTLNGQPMIDHVVELALNLRSARTVVVVGHRKEVVINHILNRVSRDVEFAEQEKQLGTGHAVMQTEKALAGFEGDVLVLSGDVPLLTKETMMRFIEHHYETGAVATILTAEIDDPTGYGRIIRNGDGTVRKIVEHRDATPQEREIREINSGIYLFDKKHLFEALRHIEPHNVQNEYYLTDVFEYFWKHNLKVAALKARDFDEIRGVNTVEQLEKAREVIARHTDNRS